MAVCYRCGNSQVFRDFLCYRCYFLSFHPKLPNLELKYCTRCNRYFWRGKPYPNLEFILDLVRESNPEIDFLLEIREIRIFSDKLQLELELRSGSIIRKLKLLAKHSRFCCSSCLKLRSRYYEAILQLRGMGNPPDPSKLAEMDRQISRMLNPGEHIVQLRDHAHGRDYLLSSNSAAARISRELSRKYAAKLIKSSSNKGGKLRYVYSIRI